MGRDSEYGQGEDNKYGWNETLLGPLPDKDRIQLRLSPLALQTLDQNSSILFQTVNRSGFVNKLIHCYFRRCSSNVEEALRIRRQELEIWIPDYCRTIASKKQAAECLLNNKEIEISMYLSLYRQELVKQLEARCARGTSDKARITLDAESKNILYRKQDYTFRKSNDRLQMRQVLAAMVEEFTELGNLEREGILYADLIQKLQNCCPRKIGKEQQPGEVISFRYFSGTGWKFHKNIRPFAVAPAVQNRYYYLYAMNGKNPEKFRISRIEEDSIQILETPHRTDFTDEEIDHLHDKMSGEDSDVADFEVYLDPEGVRMFEQIQYLRPVCMGEGKAVTVKGKTETVWKCYLFHAAAYDMRNYFIRLLPHAVIVDRDNKNKVHDEMQRIIRSAEKSYSNIQFTQSEN